MAPSEVETFYVYVFVSESTGGLYTGQTKDLPRRASEHNGGLSSYTKGRGPWVLFHSEEFATRSEAMMRERYLKTGADRDWLRTVIITAASDS
ncbi:MAG: GIY-YIG nuclease family protein [Chloroflexi bacterium]|nr:GIY-YIG nuclease family protein [Chloroflexota bacterium]MDA1228189.1 GIY-YIG nuclease family protein [Chloroflexota bacterium]